MGYDELGTLISKAILSDFDKKIKYDLSLEECLKKYTIDELMRFYYVHLVYNKDLTNLLTFRTLNGQKKDEIVSEVASNIRDIMYSYLSILNTSVLNEYKKYFKDSNRVSLSFEKNNIRMIAITEINSLFFIDCYYDKKNNKIDLYMPECFYGIFKELVSDKVLNKINIKNNKVFKGINSLVNTYGILTFDETHELLRKLGVKVEYEDFENLVLSSFGATNCFNFTVNDYGRLIYNIAFDEEGNDVVDYCDILSDDINRNLDASIIKKIGNDEYFYELKPYKMLIKYLSNMYDGFKEDHKSFDMLIVADFIDSAQMDTEEAEENFYHNIDEEFEDLKDDAKEKILEYLWDIYNCYPKWSMRGNI